MPHFVLLILLATGAFVVTRLLQRESARVARDLERARRRDVQDGDAVKLERDPQTGVFRPRRRHQA